MQIITDRFFPIQQHRFSATILHKAQIKHQLHSVLYVQRMKQLFGLRSYCVSGPICVIRERETGYIV